MIQTESGASGAAQGSGGHRRRRLLVIPLVLILLLLAAGTTAAFTVPVVNVTPAIATASMLPSSTVLYITADLNPSGAKQATLSALERDFTEQPGWPNVARQFNSTARQQPDANRCYQQTRGQVSDHLSELGHDSAFALIGTQGMKTGATQTGAERNMVFLASLNVHMTLAQALSGLQLSLPQKTASHRGVTIYQEFFPSCGKIRQGTPDSIYAALYKGYVLLGLTPNPIERVVDTVSGGGATLASVPSYRRLMAQLPSDRLAAYYLDSPALRKLSGATLQQLPTTTLATGTSQPAAGALTAEANGFRLTAVGGTIAHASPAAGQLASQLPADTLAFVSLQDVGAMVRKTESVLRKDGLLTGRTAQSVNPILNDLTADLSGEVDLAFLRPPGRMKLSTSNLNAPLALLWQVRNSTSARSHLDDLARRLDLSATLHNATALDGTAYRVSGGGYGLAVRRNWAIASFDIARTIGGLAAPPAAGLASTAAYRRVIPAGSTPSSIWYVDLHGLRTELEASLLPSVSPSQRSQYNSTAHPILVPLQTLSGSSGVTHNGRLSISQVFLGIGR